MGLEVAFEKKESIMKDCIAYKKGVIFEVSSEKEISEEGTTEAAAEKFPTIFLTEQCRKQV